MDKYLSQKYEIYRHQMCSFKFHMHQNPFSAAAPPRTLGVPSEGGQSKANMSWIFLKIPPLISWKFA